MPAARELTQRRATEVAFEVERVGWPSPDRLEVVGRWYGVRGRRFIRPTLTVEVGGEPRRMLAVLDHKPWAVEDGQAWTAAFEWRGEPVDLAGGELTVGSDIAVELAPPDGQHAARRRFARRPRADVLEGELEKVRREARRLGNELHALRAEHNREIKRTTEEHDAELERARVAQAAAEEDAERRDVAFRAELEAERRQAAQLEAAARKAREELAVARADAVARREDLERERAAIAAEASKAVADEVEALRLERDAARRESANARAERDAARRESANARAERDAAFRERDSARQARNAFLSRAKGEAAQPAAEPNAPVPASASAGPAPARRTVVRIPAEPEPELEPPTAALDELDWQPAEPRPDRTVRIAAITALLVLAALLVLLLSSAL